MYENGIEGLGERGMEVCREGLRYTVCDRPLGSCAKREGKTG
jgi:hypothetical protein